MQPEESRRSAARAAADAASDEYDRVADSSSSGDAESAPDAVVEILKNRPYFVSTMVSQSPTIANPYSIVKPAN